MSEAKPTFAAEAGSAPKGATLDDRVAALEKAVLAEANGNKAISAGTVVQMTLVGYDTSEDKQPVYVFTYGVAQPDPGLVPIHDHRDNITGGGFAFSVYHPGTGMPQQPWHV